jgi:CRISPR-associated endonuclease/helicase Cas3
LKGIAVKAREIAENKTFSIEPDMDLAEIAYIIGASHDFGKGTTFFQKYLINRDEDSSTYARQHSSISAFFCYYLLKKYGFHKGIPILGWYVIQRHHSNLSDLTLHPDRGEIYRKTKRNSHIELLKEQVRDIKDNTASSLQKIYNELDLKVDVSGFFSKILDESIFKEFLKDYYRDVWNHGGLGLYIMLIFLYSTLLDSDKLDSARVETPPRTPLEDDLVDHYKRERFGPPKRRINELREMAYSRVLGTLESSDLETRRFSITLPTGLGKTLIGFQAALQLRKRIREAHGFDPRIIYSLPFLSIIEQNYDVLEQVLQTYSYDADPGILLKHHYLSTGYVKEGEDYNQGTEGILLTEGWHSEIIVTTFVQFFESLITRRNSMARKFHNMTNSIIILDEIQTVPRKYWEIIREALIILSEEYNSWIILMTATNPLVFDPREEIKELTGSKEEFYNELDRVDFFFDLKEKDLDEFKFEVLKCFKENPGKDIMVVLNTINSSKKMYQILKNSIGSREGLEYIYLSTHILPQDRLRRIEKIKESDSRLLIVTTQLIEAGVDIDVDIIFRDFSPLDSIIQTAGRCNRENRGGRGEVHIKKLIDENTNRSFASYIYDDVLLGATEELLSNVDKIPEAEFNLRYADKYFERSRKRGGVTQRLLENIKNLEYSEIRDFKLIEEKYNSVSFFIERDEGASEVMGRLEEVLEGTYGYVRRSLFLPLKRDFYNYVIDVRIPEKDLELVEYLEPLKTFQDIYVVERRVLGDWYSEETGFKLPEETIDFRMI